LEVVETAHFHPETIANALPEMYMYHYKGHPGKNVTKLSDDEWGIFINE